MVLLNNASEWQTGHGMPVQCKEGALDAPCMSPDVTYQIQLGQDRQHKNEKYNNLKLCIFSHTDE